MCEIVNHTERSKHDMTEVLALTVEAPRKFESEKDSYRYFDRYFKKKGFKVYSQVLRGFPDYIVSEFEIEGLDPGFVEVKFEDNALRPSQVKVMHELSKIAPTYLCRARRDGRLELYHLKF